MTTRRRTDNLTPMEKYERAQREYDEAVEALFRATDVMADYLEDDGPLITDLTPGTTRLCRKFIVLREAVDRVQVEAHQLGMYRMLAGFPD